AAGKFFFFFFLAPRPGAPPFFFFSFFFCSFSPPPKFFFFFFFFFFFLFYRSGRFGLYISDPFEKGYTETCATFANEALTGPGSPCEFDVLELEAWGFEVYMQSQAI
ncbi:MAG: hypothetical protein BJ554DRAFT_3350, partial [Olpidium bornovanus]